MPIKFSELESISYDNVDSFIGLQKDSQGRYYNKLIQKSSLTSNIDTQIKNILNTMYPLGSLYLAMKRMDKCPLELLGVGTWTRDAENRCLQGSSNATTPGTSIEPGLPNVEHTHWISTYDDGLGHKITVNSAGNHTHTRGSMNITGTTFGENKDLYDTSYSGAFYRGEETNKAGVGKYDHDNNLVYFDASRSWTGSTSSNGNHTHTLAGSTQLSHISESQKIYGRSNTVQPPAYVVDVWKRIG
jgi:hypothetical protein